jgi:hypothetical protein
MTDRSPEEWIRRILLANELRYRRLGKRADPIPYSHLYNIKTNKEPIEDGGSVVGIDSTTEPQAEKGPSPVIRKKRGLFDVAMV